MIIALCSGGLVAAQGIALKPPAEDLVWITIGEDVFDHLSRGEVRLSLPVRRVASDAGVVITRLSQRDLQAVSAYVHRKTLRCGGYIVHDSLAEAEAAMERAARTSYAAPPADFAIDQQTLVNQLLPDLDDANILSTITHLSTAYNNRYYQNTSGQQAALWIRDQWQTLATGRSDVTVTTYNHAGYVQPSVIMTIDGATLPGEVIVLGAHLDSIRSGANNTDPATLAPGADDDASGIATLTEVIRVLMANGVTPDRTIKFMGYAAEETGLQGSGDIAADHATAGTNVVAVMQLDMTDFNGSAEDIVLIDDFTNVDLTSFVIDLVTTYLPALSWTYTTCGYACSDHASWTNQGFPSVFPFEARFGQHNQAIHTGNDTVATIGNSAAHALKFAQVATAFAIETGFADCTPAAVAGAGADRAINEGSSTIIGTPALAGHTYSWSPGGATTAEVSVSPATTTTYTVTATTSCGSAQDSVDVTVIPAGGGGPQTAVYDIGLGTPACTTVGSSCDSTTLVDGRANLGPEPNQPNTLDTCSDGASGSYHSDESSDRLVVSTLDSADFAEGATVQVDATVYAWSTGTSDHLDLYYAADATNPSWQLITTIDLTSGGTQTLSAQYTLPAGALQAVRANFRYQGTASSCSTGSYDDHDDLVFAVGTVAQCSVDADCDDGAYCNGAETCNAGTCEAGTAPTCEDGAFCNGTETCNETTDTCDAGSPPACDDGQFCNGSETCNEGTDSCDAGTPVVCGDGQFCNGTETCNEATDSCDAGTAPTCDDSVGCTVDSCNEGTDSCDNVATDSLCDNGNFCDGAETCDAVGDCQAGSDPCPGQSCDEGTDSCVACIVDADCSDGLFCNGAETCNAGVCQGGTPPVCDDGQFCNGTESCDEGTDSCDAGAPPACDDGAFCNGTESCNEGTDSCDAGTAPCDPGTEVCNEGTDTCDVPGGNPVIWMSFRSNTAVPGVGAVADEDIVSYDEGSGTWALEFDGSDVGLGGLEISGLGILPGGDLLLSFTTAGTVGGLSVDDSDIVQFTPTSMGSTTAGTFSIYFDGSDVALTSNGEDIDSIAFVGGQLAISTTGGFSGTGASGADEDLFIFTGSLGSSTSGSFSQHFDGSDVGLGGNSAEDVDAATFTAAGELLFSTVGTFAVTGLGGQDEDVAEFTGSFGSSTSGTFSMRQDLSALGIAAGEDIGSMHVVE